MVKAIYFLKPAWCGRHFAGLRPEWDLQSVNGATAFQAVVFTPTLGMTDITPTMFFPTGPNAPETARNVEASWTCQFILAIR